MPEIFTVNKISRPEIQIEGGHGADAQRVLDIHYLMLH